MKNRVPNRLIHAASPYLLQHAYNPVDWFEWGPEALEKAKAEDKPILVSIGYSSCHWCHVMERESFEKEEVASVMNQYYVCIKVDREERPDIDQIYMDAVQALGINGGWPLNVFLTPDQKPFFGGTYFTPSAWTQILVNIDKAFRLNRQQIEDTSEELSLHLLRSDVERFTQKPQDTALDQELEEIYLKLKDRFDTVWGGLDKAPKFIMPSIWLFLMRYHYISKNEAALAQVVLTLKRIAMGGIYDQVGGGFARYSVDAYWFAPHFEKMLYDNAQLLSLYAEAYTLTKDEGFKDVVYETFEWLQREMTHAQGGFFSAIDADSEGVEGKFYIWTKEELDQLLGEDAPLINEYYRVTDTGNWEHGYNILMRDKSDAVFLKSNGITPDRWKEILVRSKKTMLQRRSMRARPGLDDKIIAAWNAMTICGLTDAYKAFGDRRFLHAAQGAMRFLENELMEGLLVYRSFRQKRSPVHAFLDDYAYVIQAYTRLYQVTFDEYYLKRATAFLTYVIDHFQDAEDGFFFYTSSAAEDLIARKKELFDNVIPSSNAIMVQNLYHLGILDDRAEWKGHAERLAGALGHLITSEPNYMSHWAMAYAEIRKEMAEVVMVGAEASAVRDAFQQRYHPFALMLGTTDKSDLALLRDKPPLGGKTTIYVCYNKRCRLPVYTIQDAEAQFSDKPIPALRHP
ncbi:MAG TPA: thioredoxin domain-containing protein [Ohtaekwangia sp.]|nr:thioredoxin domain-containing protein [Ohtaekwangia sp.]